MAPFKSGNQEDFMGSSYSTFVLRPEFAGIEVKLHPGHPFPADDRSIKLAGGFPILFPESSPILSPTLQLNKDLSSTTEGFLKQIAQAELARHGRAELYEYTVDPSLLVCVIAAEPECLEGFLDIYGGLLEIEPIVVTAKDPDYPELLEMDIIANNHGYLVATTHRSPFDRMACSYCGACGPACPEGCISPWLDLDFDKCTYCGKCETACQLDAIDIHGVLKKELQTPAIILLGDFPIELPENRSHIYPDSSIQDYLKTLCSLHVEEAVQCDQRICQYSDKLKSGCCLCIEVCSYGAIGHSAGGIRVDSQLCAECGRCCSVCPTGAMGYKRFSDAVFFDYFRQVDLFKTTNLVIGKESALHDLWWQSGKKEAAACFFLEHPCPESLSLYHFLYLCSCGVSRIAILDDPVNPVSRWFRRKIAGFNTLLAALLKVDEAVVVTVIDQLDALKGEADRPPVRLQLAGDFNNRRTSLAKLLGGYYLDSEEEIALENTMGSFATVICNEKLCTHCYACLNECKIGALKASQDGRSLLYTSALCVGCNVCCEICPEDALQIEHKALLGAAFTKAVELARAEPILCRECGKDFGTRKSFLKVTRLLASKGVGNQDYLEYCDTCRVVKRFEASEFNEQ